jgi:hypothetical protein
MGLLPREGHPQGCDGHCRRVEQAPANTARQGLVRARLQLDDGLFGFVCKINSENTVKNYEEECSKILKIKTTKTIFFSSYKINP